jgi:hypothetical protein
MLPHMVAACAFQLDADDRHHFLITPEQKMIIKLLRRSYL